MRKRLTALSVVTLMVGLCFLSFTSSVLAAGGNKLPWADSLAAKALGTNELSLQEIFNSLGYGYINTATDETGIETWCVLPGQNLATMVIEVAGSATTAKSGWYVANNASPLNQLFDGTAVPGSSVNFSVSGSGSIGFYMQPGLSGPVYVWYTQSAMNSDFGSPFLGNHAKVYRTVVPHEYLVCWEDLPEGGDQDYQDLVLKITFANQIPVLTLPADYSVFQCSPAPICFNISATDANCEGDILTLEKISGAGTFTTINQAAPINTSHCFTPTTAGVYQFIFKVTDIAGATDYKTLNITVTLNRPPVVSCPSNTTVLACNLDPICIPGFSATDPDGNLFAVTVNGVPLTPNPGSACFVPVVGVNTLTLTATDACGATTSCITTVTVTLNQPPVVTCPSNSTVFACNLDPICIPGFGATDPDDNLTSVTVNGVPLTPNPGSACFTPVVGVNTLELIATDACGATASCITTVTVTLNQAPMFTVCPTPEAEIPVLWGETMTGYVAADDPDDGPDALKYTLVSFKHGGTAIDGPGTFTVTEATGDYNWPTVFGDFAYSGEFDVTIKVFDGCKADTCTFNVYVTHHAGVSAEIWKLHGVIQGHYAFVPVDIYTGGLEMGGFDLLIGYDASALTLNEVLPGAQISDPTRWEYFTYRFGATGNCNGPCPSGLVRIVAIADMNNGIAHPVEAAYLLNGTVATLKFLVTNNRTFECQFVPLGFYWIDCTDNVLSSKDGQQAYIARYVWYYTGDDYPDEELIRIDNAVDSTSWGGYAGWKNTLDPYCLVAEQGKPMPLDTIDFYDGGIDIACADSIDLRGDLNLNGIANEIADAVIYTQYFLIGITAFPEWTTTSRQGAIAASDVNADGKPLTIGDLVYLIRIISGDALPYAKLAPFAQDVNVRFDGQVVVTESKVNIGAVLLTFKVGENFKITNLTSLTLGQSLTAGELKVLLYDISTKSIGSGLRELVRIEGQAELVTAEVADYNGNMLTSKLGQATLPMTFALGQNYPNPFNPETVIEFALPTTGEVSLRIYNVAGQLVRTLVSGTTPAGYYQIRWDGRDANGSDVSSGVYFYKIDTKNFSETRKMLLVK